MLKFKIVNFSDEKNIELNRKAKEAFDALMGELHLLTEGECSIDNDIIVTIALNAVLGYWRSAVFQSFDKEAKILKVLKEVSELETAGRLIGEEMFLRALEERGENSR